MQMLPEFKRGDTFFFTATIADVTVANLKSQVRDKNDKLYADLTITESGVPNEYILRTDNTLSWPIETLFVDIKIIKDGVTKTSCTIDIPVVKEVTKA